MTATTIVEGARVATLILVLVLAAALGLVVGNALQAARSTVGVGAATSTTAVDRGTPSFADPYRQLIREASAADGADHSSLRGLTPR